MIYVIFVGFVGSEDAAQVGIGLSTAAICMVAGAEAKMKRKICLESKRIAIRRYSVRPSRERTLAVAASKPLSKLRAVLASSTSYAPWYSCTPAHAHATMTTPTSAIVEASMGTVRAALLTSCRVGRWCETTRRGRRHRVGRSKSREALVDDDDEGGSALRATRATTASQATAMTVLITVENFPDVMRPALDDPRVPPFVTAVFFVSFIH